MNNNKEVLTEFEYSKIPTLGQFNSEVILEYWIGNQFAIKEQIN